VTTLDALLVMATVIYGIVSESDVVVVSDTGVPLDVGDGL
jgi:hypothetical protein